MNSKKWIKIFLIFSVLGVGFAGAVNFVVDPGYIYLKKNFNNNVDEYAKKLFTSEKGLIATGWNERVVKSAMAKYAGNFDCVILGSSHIIQISQVRHTGNIQQVCPKLLNLGVSGASLEDLIVFTDIIFENDSKHSSHKFPIDIPKTNNAELSIFRFTLVIYKIFEITASP